MIFKREKQSLEYKLGSLTNLVSLRIPTRVLLNPHLGFVGFPFMKTMTSARLIKVFNLSSRGTPVDLMVAGSEIGLILAVWLILAISSAGLAPFTVSQRSPSRNISIVGTAEILYLTETSGTTSASSLAKWIFEKCSSVAISSRTEFIGAHWAAHSA